MTDKFDESAIGKSFDEINYIELADDAAQRTRWTAIILVIATVITFIGFYNSTRSSWAYNRLDSIYNNENIGELNIRGDNDSKPILDSFFGSEDFKDAKTFKIFVCELLNKQSSGFSKYVYESLNARTRSLANDECKPEYLEDLPSDLIRISVAFDLNTILKDRHLYKYRQSLGLNHPRQEINYLYNHGQTQNLRYPHQEVEYLYERAGNSTNILKINELIRLNRLLLEDEYPQILKARNIIPIDSDDDGNTLSPFEKFRLQAQNEIARAYVDNIQYINIPVFGISIDVNDLGLIGGISLIVILALYRFNLSREIKNLNISFREAFRHGKLDTFYHNLAMRQVLTVPEMKGETKNTILDYSAKLISLLPALVLIYGVYYDWYSVLSLTLFEFSVYWKLLCIELALAAFIFALSLKCLERKLHIDEIWNDYYYLLQSKITYEFIKKGKFDTKGRFQRIIRERFFDESDKKFWLWKLLKRFPVFLKKVLGRLLVDNRFPIWITGRDINSPEFAGTRMPSEVVDEKLKEYSKYAPPVSFICLFIVSAIVYLSLIFDKELSSVYESVSNFLTSIETFFRELWKQNKPTRKTIALVSMLIGLVGIVVYRRRIFDFIKEKRKERARKLQESNAEEFKVEEKKEAK